MLLQEEMDDVAHLKPWLKQKQKIKFLFLAITNEIFNDFSSGVLTKLQQDSQKAKYYAIILEETSDVLGKARTNILSKLQRHCFNLSGLYALLCSW